MRHRSQSGHRLRGISTGVGPQIRMPGILIGVDRIVTIR
jgi:hypothetical protein